MAADYFNDLFTSHAWDLNSTVYIKLEKIKTELENVKKELEKKELEKKEAHALYRAAGIEMIEVCGSAEVDAANNICSSENQAAHAEKAAATVQ